MKKRSTSMYGISRIDDEIYHTHAWRVSLRRRGKMHVKNFPDKTWGGKLKALTAAKQHRDKVLAENPPLTRKEFSSAMRSNNNSGITGVYTYAKKYRLADSTEMETWYWEAHWPTSPGESKSVRFSVKEYGDERARQLAIEAREQGMKDIEGVFWASEPSIEILTGQAERRSSESKTGQTRPKAAIENTSKPDNEVFNPFNWFPFGFLSPLTSSTSD